MTLFFYGTNSYALRRQLRQMVVAYSKKAGSDYGLERIDGSVVKPRDLLATLQAIPFLASSRLVIVEGVAVNKPAAEKLTDIMAKVPVSTVVVFVEREVDRRTSAFRSLSKADKVVNFEPVTGPKLLGWMKAEVERLGGTASREAVTELVDLAGEDQWRLAEEIQKLVNYAPGVTIASVRELVTPGTERSIFDMVEAMAAGKAELAVRGYHDLLRQRESEIYVLTMVQWQLRNLLLAKTAPNMSPADLATAAGMSPFVAGKMMSAQGNMSEKQLKQAFVAAVNCEFDIKSGRLKAEAAVEQLIWRVATAADYGA